MRRRVSSSPQMAWLARLRGGAGLVRRRLAVPEGVQLASLRGPVPLSEAGEGLRVAVPALGLDGPTERTVKPVGAGEACTDLDS